LVWFGLDRRFEGSKGCYQNIFVTSFFHSIKQRDVLKMFANASHNIDFIFEIEKQIKVWVRLCALFFSLQNKNASVRFKRKEEG